LLVQLLQALAYVHRRAHHRCDRATSWSKDRLGRRFPCVDPQSVGGASLALAYGTWRCPGWCAMPGSVRRGVMLELLSAKLYVKAHQLIPRF
jgi:hypothetical protein